MEKYLITVIVLHICALLVYEVLLKKTTFLTGNRIYLLVVPVILWFVPFINIGVLNPSPVIPESIPYEATTNFEFTSSTPEFHAPDHTVQTLHVEPSGFEFSWWWLYYLGAVISLLWFIRNYYLLHHLKSKGIKHLLNDTSYVSIPQSNLAMSFMGSILIGDQIDKQHLPAVLAHEKVHIEQRHHLDLLLYQVLNIVLWLNPFNYIFLNRLKLTHELLADRSVANQVGKKDYAALLLNETFATSAILFANAFIDLKTIKTRISMLSQKSSPRIARLRYTSFIIILITAVVYTSCTTFKKEEPSLEKQISELNDRLKKLDSISLKDLEAFDDLQMAITSYSIDDNSQYAIISKENDIKVIDSIYKLMKSKSYQDSVLKVNQIQGDTLYSKYVNYHEKITRKEYSEFMKWVGDSINTSKYKISKDGKILTFNYKSHSGVRIRDKGNDIKHKFNFSDDFELPLYSEFKLGQKDFYKGISVEDKLWYENYDYKFWDAKKDMIIDSSNVKQLVKDLATYRRTKEGMRYFEIKRQVTSNGTSIVIDDSIEPRNIMTIIESPNGKVQYGTFPSQNETNMSDIQYEVFKYWAIKNYPSMKNSISYSREAISDYYKGEYIEL